MVCEAAFLAFESVFGPALTCSYGARTNTTTKQSVKPDPCGDGPGLLADVVMALTHCRIARRAGHPERTRKAPRFLSLETTAPFVEIASFHWGSAQGRTSGIL